MKFNDAMVQVEQVDEVDDEWDALEQEGITDRVALFFSSSTIKVIANIF